MAQLKVFESSDPEEYKRRFALFTGIIITLVGIIALRLWFLQVIRGEEFKRLSENNRIRLETIPPCRGQIYDRNGVLVVDNRPSFNLCVESEDIRNKDNLVFRLSHLLGCEASEIEGKIGTSQNRPPFKPTYIKKDLTWVELSLIKMHKLDLPGVIIEVEPTRNYPLGQFASHLIGYVGEIDERELTSRKFPSNEMGDFIGKSGVERRWHDYLDGVRGGRQLEVDVLGRNLRLLGETNPHPGKNIFLTLDHRLQRLAEDLFEEKAGCIIAMNPKNGEILALASSPSFDPNAFAKGITIDEWKSLITNPLHPLENKAFQGQYPPGSVFKIVVATAALEEKVLSLNTQILCRGRYRCGNRIYRCWRRGGHGTMDFHTALVQSCDVFFYQVGQRLGIDKIARYSRTFGLGMLTGIDLKDEKSGLVPTSHWKLERYGIPWQEGETLSCAIGQGFFLVTPLQMAVATSAVANGGVIYRPQIVRRIEDNDGKVIKEFPPISKGLLPVSSETLSIIKDGLFGVVNEPKGTGWRARSKMVTVCGKTGTAQVVRLDENKRHDEKDVPYLYRDHAWFVAFAPKEDSEITVVVLLEHSGHGGAVAAPLAKEIIEEYFRIRADDV